MINKNLKNTLINLTLILSAVIFTLGNSTTAFGISDNYTTKRLGGTDRYDTAIAISNEYAAYSNNNLTSCIIARDDDFADSISVTPFSYYKNAPILLTQHDDLNTKTKAQLKKLNIKNVFIIGGMGVISENVENQLKNLGYNITRIGGKDRIETNRLLMAQIPKDVWGPRPKVINGYDWVQGMSVAQDTTFWYPMDNKTYINPIFVIGPNANSSDDIKDIGAELEPVKTKWLNSRYGADVKFNVPYKVCIDENFDINIANLAQSKGLSPAEKQWDNFFDNILSSLGNYTVQETLYTGYNQPTTQTNVFINDDYKVIDMSPMKDQVMAALLTRGDNFIDALAATPLSAKLRSPIVMANKPASQMFDKETLGSIKLSDFEQTYGNVDKIYYIGGSSVIKNGSESFLNGN